MREVWAGCPKLEHHIIKGVERIVELETERSLSLPTVRIQQLMFINYKGVVYPYPLPSYAPTIMFTISLPYLFGYTTYVYQLQRGCVPLPSPQLRVYHNVYDQPTLSIRIHLLSSYTSFSEIETLYSNQIYKDKLYSKEDQ